jgi:hypothetical protein
VGSPLLDETRAILITCMTLYMPFTWPPGASSNVVCSQVEVFSGRKWVRRFFVNSRAAGQPYAGFGGRVLPAQFWRTLGNGIE